MNKKIVVCLFFILILSPVIYAADMQMLEITNFRFGVLSLTSGGELIVSKEATVFPNQEGLTYGFTYDFKKHSAAPINEKVLLELPSSPTAVNNLENRNTVSTNKKNTVVVSDSPMADQSGTWNFGLKIDKGDPSGKYAITIEHDGVIFKHIEYVVE